jgi:hypothetical protein
MSIFPYHCTECQARYDLWPPQDDLNCRSCRVQGTVQICYCHSASAEPCAVCQADDPEPTERDQWLADTPWCAEFTGLYRIACDDPVTAEARMPVDPDWFYELADQKLTQAQQRHIWDGDEVASDADGVVLVTDQIRDIAGRIQKLIDRGIKPRSCTKQVTVPLAYTGPRGEHMTTTRTCTVPDLAAIGRRLEELNHG